MITSGPPMMAMLSVGSLDSHNMVYYYYLVLDLYFIITVGSSSQICMLLIINFKSSRVYVFCPAASLTQPGGTYGAGSGPIHLGSLQCTGNEVNVTDCPNGSISSCTHANDAGLTCRASMFIIIMYHLLIL